ncbi:hypothetical protein [Nocardioides sp. Root151]|uniref:hypothetical protein n=1 Tax=Nocardioides sp. Root151 TaxID=1736475 RepID=UPI0007028622|nr:hypothetical protein [Nocardioides sp. Root151]KQZ76180.1 hypothetical protein ASD66_07875 [Nocardioides sp. Root151]
MNNHGNDKLHSALSSSSDVMADSRLDFGAMEKQARGIRRRRRIGTGVAAAAVLAVIAVPTTLALNQGDDRGSEPGPADGTSQVPDASESPDKGSGKGSDKGGAQLADDKAAATQALEDLPAGDAPGVDYVYENTVHVADGSTLPLPQTQASIITAAGYHGGWLVGTADNEGINGDVTLRQFDAQGTEVSATEAAGSLVVSNDGTQLAWWTWNQKDKVGELHSAGASGMGEGDGAVQETGKASYVLPVGYVGVGELVFQPTVEGVGPTVKVADFTDNVRDIDTLGSASGTDQINNRIAGQAPGDGLTGRVVDGTTGEEIWHKDGWRLGRFSPDGTHLIAYESNSPDPQPIAILDAATGEVVTQINLHDEHGLGYGDVVWEDDDSLLVNAYVFAGTDAEPHPGALLRLGLDGDLERATDVDPGTDFWFFLPRS